MPDTFASRLSSFLKAIAFCGAVLLTASSASAQSNVPYYMGAVGGVSCDARGVVTRATVTDLEQIRSELRGALAPVASELAAESERRVVSLRGLEAELSKATAAGKAIPDEVHYLAGLRRVEFVLVDAARHDILLVGPAEGWKVDGKGNIVGLKSELPVMQLDDLLTALRSADVQEVISCSIDPTPEGITRLRELNSQLGPGNAPQANAEAMSAALGEQTVTVTGVPAESHFARVLVAADFRMKSISLAFEPSPVRSLPSFLSMMNRSHTAAAPRFWLEPTYAEVVRNESGSAWRLAGSSVKAMSETEYVSETGQRQATGRTDAASQRWTERMTKSYPELAKREPVFAEVQNCMDFAVVAALLRQAELTRLAGYDFPVLFGKNGNVQTAECVAPQRIPSGSNFVRQGNGTLYVSGGVALNPYSLLAQAKTDTAVETTLDLAVMSTPTHWWWEGGM